MTAEQISEVQRADGIWKVQIIGEDLQIVDPQGRQRHASIGHAMTGIHLAMRLELMPPGGADEALRLAAESFGER